MEAQEENIKTRRDIMYDAITMFDAAKRKVYRHCRYPMPVEIARSMGGTATSSLGALYVRLESQCRDCGEQHTLMDRKTYL